QAIAVLVASARAHLDRATSAAFVVEARRIGAVDLAVAVVIQPVVADFGARIRAQAFAALSALRIGTVDAAVAIIVDPVVAIFYPGAAVAADVAGTVAVVAVGAAVTVVVDAVAADFIAATAVRAAHTIGIV